MQAGSVYRVRTVAALHFAGALAQNAALVETLDCKAGGNVVGDHEAIAAGRHMRSRLRELRIISQQNLAWEVWLFGTSTIGGAVIGAEKLLGKWAFAEADGTNATGDSFYYYYVNGDDLAYQDLLNAGCIYARLINRSAVAKLAAGAGGNLEVEFALELLQGR